jgi:predicted DNA-binding ribbon-helix-helix protein
VTPPGTTSHKRSVLIAGHHTSVSLEDDFWAALKEIAETRGVSLNRLIAEIDRDRGGNLSSAIRLFVLHTLKEARRWR